MNASEWTWRRYSTASGCTVLASPVSTAAFSFGVSAISRAASRKLSDKVVRHSATSPAASSSSRCSPASASRVTRTLTTKIAAPIATTASSELARKIRLVSEARTLITVN